MKKLGIGIMLLLASGFTNASLIERQLSHQGGHSWLAEYRLSNDSILDDIEEFSLYYDFGLFDNLQIVAAPDNWNDTPFVDNPYQNAGFEFDGIVDFLVNSGSAGIANGQTLGGFWISFDWLGLGDISEQKFEIINPDNFDIIDSGLTSQIIVSSPATIALYLLGLITLFVSRNIRNYVSEHNSL